MKQFQAACAFVLRACAGLPIAVLVEVTLTQHLASTAPFSSLSYFLSIVSSRLSQGAV